MRPYRNERNQHEEQGIGDRFLRPAEFRAGVVPPGGGEVRRPLRRGRVGPHFRGTEGPAARMLRAGTALYGESRTTREGRIHQQRVRHPRLPRRTGPAPARHPGGKFR